MSPERWQRVTDLFTKAVELERSQQQGFLERACEGDDKLVSQVLELLRADADDQDLFTPSAVRSPRGKPGAEGADGLPEERLGPYRLLRKIGTGGMSDVFLAVRADDQYDQQVAIKVLRSSLVGTEILHRFRQERQILAGLDHPHIARILDGGTTAAGLPYFVLEYVDGQAIDQHCRGLELSVADRLQLFRAVCAGIRRAHQNLIIHRDIKPSNVLVTREGVVKLLDFGIAKWLDPGLSDSELGATSPSLRIMTLAYASPEQVRGEVMTTASDVYSLGVLLYELLTGARPYDLEGDSRHQAEARVCDEQPPAPSRRVNRAAAPGLYRQLKGDLDSIVLKALRKEPSRRYASVEELSEDLRRHLEFEPVLARRDSWGYRIGKFARRNRLAASLSVALLVALVAFGIAMTVLAVRTSRALAVATRERAIAARETARAQQVSTFLTDLFESADPRQEPNRELTVQKLLERGVQRAEEDQQLAPELRASLLETLGKVHRSLGLYPQAGTLLEEALHLRQSGARPGDGNQAGAASGIDVARSLSLLASLRLSEHDLKAAEELNRQALALRREHLAPQHPDVAESLHQLAEALHTQGRFEEAEAGYRQALEIRSVMSPAVMSAGVESGSGLGVIETSADLGFLLMDLGQLAEAKNLLQDALERGQQLFPDSHPVIADIWGSLALLSHRQERLEEAEGFARKAVELHGRLHGEEHPAVAAAMNDLGLILWEREQLDEAERVLRSSLDKKVAALGEDDPSVGTNLSDLALVLRDKGDFASAEALFLQALEIFIAQFGEEHPASVIVQGNLADLAFSREQYDLAAQRYAAIASRQALVFPAGDRRLGYTRLKEGMARSRQGDCRRAEPLLVQSVEMAKESHDAGAWQIAWAESQLGICWLALGRKAEAREILSASVPILEGIKGEDDPLTREPAAALAQLVLAKPGLASPDE